MPALSGSDKAYRQARAGIMRAGASRFGYFVPNVAVTINGVAVTVLHESISVRLALNDEPDSASFLMKPGTSVPTAGNVVVIGLGTAANAEFAGQIIDLELERTQGLDNPWIRVTCIDWAKLFNGRMVTADFSGQSGTTIAQTIVADYTTGFSDDGIKAGMATVDEFICINEPPRSALARLANILGGACLCGDARKIVHLWDSGGPSSAYQPTAPTTLTNSLSTLKAFKSGYDIGQARTRVIVEGRATRTMAEVPVGASSAPIEYGWMFDPAGGVVRIGSQVLNYTYTLGLAGILPSRPSAIVTADVSPGDFTFAVDDNSAIEAADLTNNQRWLMDEAGNLFFALMLGLSSTDIDVPAALGEYGAVQKPIPAGTAIYVVDAIFFPALEGPTAVINVGEAVTVRHEEDDAAAQAAVAAASGIVGDDGVREHPVSDPELSYIGARARALAELATFGEQLERASWTTYDMNAKPGARQAVNISGIGALSTTLTIQSVALDFPLPNHPPRRTCEAGDVKLATILDVIKG